MTNQMEGQMSIFDLDTWYGKTFQEPSAVTKAKTSKRYSRKSSESSKQTLPMFLFLKKDGTSQEYSWENLGVSLTKSMMLNSGVSRRGENVLLSLRTLADILPHTFCLEMNFGEKPKIPNPTKLSDILEENADPKYSLSAKACAGILNRAQRRGKELPEVLRQALENQINEDNDGLHPED